jgi:hypothetical protein
MATVGGGMPCELILLTDLLTTGVDNPDASAQATTCVLRTHGPWLLSTHGEEHYGVSKLCKRN